MLPSLTVVVVSRKDILVFDENLTIPENITLVTMDVTSLYTNIPHDDGITAYRKIWEQRTVQEPPTECSVEMLTLVLKNNNFTFPLHVNVIYKPEQ
jgi:hypothetical protein